MKKYLLLLVLFAASIFPSSCSTGNGSAYGAKSGNTENSLNNINSPKVYEIACIVTQDDNFMKTLQLGMADAAKKENAKVFMEITDGKLDKEIQLINYYISKGVDGICIHPVATDISMHALKEAEERGIRVMIAGIGIGDDYGIPYIEGDQWELGRKTGEACRKFIEKNFKGKANVAILNYKSQFPDQSNKRTEGFKSELSKLKKTVILTEQEAWLTETAAAKAGKILETYPQLNIIWSANEGGTIGSTIAVKNAGKMGQVFVFGTDVNEQLINMILSPDNILQAVTGQQPYEIGFKSFEQLVGRIKGEARGLEVIVQGIPLTRENIDGVKDFYKEYRELIGAQ